MVATQKEELVRKTKAKIIELFGPEFALTQAMESEDFFDKLGQLVAWLYGEIMLSQPRPEPPRHTTYSPTPVPWMKEEWTGTTPKWTHATTAITFAKKWAAEQRRLYV